MCDSYKLKQKSTGRPTAMLGGTGNCQFDTTAHQMKEQTKKFLFLFCNQHNFNEHFFHNIWKYTTETQNGKLWK